MLVAGDPVPAATIHMTPQATRTMQELVNDGPILLLFYLFDWSST